MRWSEDTSTLKGFKDAKSWVDAASVANKVFDSPKDAEESEAKGLEAIMGVTKQEKSILVDAFEALLDFQDDYETELTHL